MSARRGESTGTEELDVIRGGEVGEVIGFGRHCVGGGQLEKLTEKAEAMQAAKKNALNWQEIGRRMYK